MRLKKIVASISDEDILNFTKLQDKVEVVDVSINNSIVLNGYVKFLGMKIDIKLSLSILNNIENNILYLDIIEVKVLNMNLANYMTKKLLDYIIISFTDIQGINVVSGYLKLDINTLLNTYCQADLPVDLKSFNITCIEIKKSEIEVSLSEIIVNTDFKPKDIVTEAEIINS